MSCSLLERCDPYLATIRMLVKVLRRFDSSGSNEIGNAREALFHAIEAADRERARGWLVALRTSAKLIRVTDERDNLLDAVTRLEEILKEGAS